VVNWKLVDSSGPSARFVLADHERPFEVLHDKRGHVAGAVTNCEHPWAGFCTIFDVGDISSALQQAIMSAVGVGNPPANAPYLIRFIVF
jgi:hypothetical protein